jgi:Aspartyl protease/Tetratrico peptide repeat
MRFLPALICFLLLAVPDTSDVTQLRQLQQKSRFFQLREALQQPGWNESETLFYRALVKSRFGQEQAAVPDLQKFLASSADPALQRKAYEELASALLRLGHYGDAAHALGGALRVTPKDDVDRDGTRNSQALYQSLAEVSPQTVEFGSDIPTQATFNPLGVWDVPVEVNSHHGEWIFDTGANWSTLTESEAAAMGLTPRQTTSYVKGSTGAKNPLRVAVASDLRFGSAHFKNVVFLVLPDQSLYIGPLKYQIKGILGLPVIRALGCVGIAAKGAVQMVPQCAGARGEPNLFLDGWDAILDMGHGDKRLEMHLDTGANATSANPSFRDALTADEIASLKSEHDQTAGVGRIVNRKTEGIALLRVEILGHTKELTGITLLGQQPAGDQAYRDGTLGTDALTSGFTLDFNAMQLRLD